MRLAKLDRTNIMSKLKYATKYMDDIGWIIVGDPNFFLDPHNLRMDDNPF
jgi:hypothetical protein